MMGGGFGGCTINLVENHAINEISKTISSRYYSKFDIKAKIYATKINNGTSIIKTKENAAV